MGNITGRKSSLSHFAKIFGEGGLDHYKLATSAEGISFKAIQKAADECGWQLDPEGVGLHCASTGRTRYIMFVTVLIFLTCLTSMIYFLYIQGYFRDVDENAPDGPHEMTMPIVTGVISVIPFAYFWSYWTMSKDRYHYGTTDFLWGTQTISNRMSTADVDKGPLWDLVHNTEYVSGVKQQVDDIVEKMNDRLSALGLDPTSKEFQRAKKKEYKAAKKEIQSVQRGKVKADMKAKPIPEALSGKEAIPKKAVEQLGLPSGKIEKPALAFGEVKTVEKVQPQSMMDKLTGKPPQATEVPVTEVVKPKKKKKTALEKGKADLKDVIGANTQSGDKLGILDTGDGLGGYSRAGNCDVCAAITGIPVRDPVTGEITSEEGDCNTTVRCWVAIGVFSLFIAYYIVLIVLILEPSNDREVIEDGEKTFQNVMVGLSAFMILLCAGSIVALLWSIAYCPSGSEFVRRNLMGYETSFRW